MRMKAVKLRKKPLLWPLLSLPLSPRWRTTASLWRTQGRNNACVYTVLSNNGCSSSGLWPL